MWSDLTSLIHRCLLVPLGPRLSPLALTCLPRPSLVPLGPRLSPLALTCLPRPSLVPLGSCLSPSALACLPRPLQNCDEQVSVDEAVFVSCDFFFSVQVAEILAGFLLRHKFSQSMEAFQRYNMSSICRPWWIMLKKCIGCMPHRRVKLRNKTILL